MKKPVRYPGGQAKKPYRKPAAVKNRKNANLGKELEGYLDATNEAYALRGQAIVFRQNPEVTVIRNGPEITGAFHKQKAGLDYIGLAAGVPFTFDAKETRNKTSFPLSNIEDHQVDSMIQYTKHKGLAFLLIRLVEYQRVYFVTLEQLAPWWNDRNKPEGRKSIPFAWITEHCKEIGPGGGLTLHYLPAIESEANR